MSNFNRGSHAMFEGVADVVDDLEKKHKVDVHTVTLILNGQHGEFDLRVEATDDDMEDHTWTAVAYRGGGISHLEDISE